MEELRIRATTKEPLWIRSLESGREILNYDEYQREFSSGSPYRFEKRMIEASREIEVVIRDVSWLVKSFTEVNEWKEMFPNMISKAATLDVISGGKGSNCDILVQLMFAEFQMLTPMVPARQVYFVTYFLMENYPKT